MKAKTKKGIKYTLLSALVALVGTVTIAASNPDFALGRNIQILFNMFRELNLLYVDQIDPDEMLLDAADGMTSKLDPYTELIPEKEMADFEIMTTGKYGGMGAMIRQKDDYVMIMNDPSQPYYETYAIEYDRHAWDGKDWTYINLPMEEIKEMAIASLKDGNMMYYSCDVGKELNKESGLLTLGYDDYEAITGVPMTMTKGERIASFDSGSTHAMTLVAVDLDKSGKPTKWMVENSWGATAGHQGYLIMTDAWFDAYTFRLVVNKKYLTPRAKELQGKTPKLLPPWSPMFRAEE